MSRQTDKFVDNQIIYFISSNAENYFQNFVLKKNSRLFLFIYINIQMFDLFL